MRCSPSRVEARAVAESRSSGGRERQRSVAAERHTQETPNLIAQKRPWTVSSSLPRQPPFASRQPRAFSSMARNLEGRAIDVNITSTTFAKVANYFVALQVNKKGKKVRTEVSAGTEKPKFKKSSHRLDLEEELTPDTTAVLTLGAFVVLPNKSEKNARLLGSIAYNIGDAAVRLLRGSTVPEDLVHQKVRC